MKPGIIPNLDMDFSVCSDELLLRSADEVTEEIHKWDAYLNAPDDQGSTGTCEARAECARGEVLINAALGDQFHQVNQLDAIAVYTRAHEMRYPGKRVSYNSGLMLGDSLAACIDLGIYPADTKTSRIKVLPYDLAKALDQGPLTVAQNVHAGWRQVNINLETGEIPSSPVVQIAGHAVLAYGLNMGVEGTLLIAILNSWGADDWGWHGIGQINFNTFRYNSLDNPILAEIDPLWWEKSNKWREYVVHAPNGVVPIPH